MYRSSVFIKTTTCISMFLVTIATNPARTNAAIEIRTVAYVGGKAAGISDDATFSHIESVGFHTTISNSGKVAFIGQAFSLQPSPVFARGLWVENDGIMSLVALEGQQAIGAEAGINYKRISIPQLDAVGHVSFMASVMGPGIDNSNNTGIWSDTGAGLELITRRGMQAPGEAEGVLIEQLNFFRTNGAGQTMVDSRLIGPGIDLDNRYRTWIHESGMLTQYQPGIDPPLHELFVAMGPELEVQSGDPAPGFIPAKEFLGPDSSRTVTNHTGQRLFHSFLADPGAASSSTGSIWLEDDNGLRLIAYEGQQVQGMEVGTMYDYLNPFFSLNTHGHVAFRANIQGPDLQSNRGIWIDREGVLEMVADAQTHAPGTGLGVNFAIFEALGLNDRGAVVFGAQLQGLGVDDTNDRGIWLYDHGDLELIVREGNQLEVAPGDLRTIDSFQFDPTNEDNGYLSGFNDHNCLAFTATFTDGTTGVFVATPEPGSAILYSSGAILLLRSRKKLASLSHASDRGDY